MVSSELEVCSLAWTAEAIH